MAEAHPIELPERVVQAYEAGEGSYATIAALFVVGQATVKRWVDLYRATGGVLPLSKGGGNHSTVTLADIEAILAKLRDATAVELTAEFNRGRRGSARVHVSSMKRALHRFGYVVKKNAAGRWRLSAPTS